MRFRVWLIVPQTNARTVLDVDAEEEQEAIDLATDLAEATQFEGKFKKAEWACENVARS